MLRFHPAKTLLLLAMPFALAACSSSSATAPSSQREDRPAAQAGSASIGNLFQYGGTTVPAPAQTLNEVDCPEITVPSGGAAMVNPAGASALSPSLRWQASLTDVGRECRLEGDRFTFKVGAEGRVLLGRSGAAGRFTVPVRVKVVQGTKVVAERKLNTEATIAQGQSQAFFDAILEDLSVPVAAGAPDSYTIEVTLDGPRPKLTTEAEKAAAQEPMAEAQPRPVQRRVVRRVVRQPLTAPKTATPQNSPTFKDVKF